MTQTVIVTGAGSGIGAATARRFARDGWNVVLNGRTKAKLEDVAECLPSDRTCICAGDVSDASDVARLVADTVTAFGGLTCLVNNAGVAEGGAPDDTSVDAFQETMDINVTGIYNMVTAVLPYLKEQDGASIVNVSSVSGIGADWEKFAYNTSKGAVTNMTRSMALDLAPGIRVNAVAPSLTFTNMTAGVKDDEDKMALFRTRIPMQRGAEPEEVASVIAFLAGPDAGFVNGAILPVDGGLSASNGQPNFASRP